MIRRMTRRGILLVAALLAAGCSPRPAFRAPVHPDPVSPVGPMAGPERPREPGPLMVLQPLPDLEAARVRALEEAAASWLGTPYRRGGRDARGVDCSALAQSVMAELGVDLPRTAADQRGMGRSIELADARAGDLVFFRIGSRVGHVGVLMDRDRFLHSSLSRGVVVTDLSERYYARRLIEIRRVLGN